MDTAKGVDSRRLAELMGKRHDNLLRTIRTDAEKLGDPERYYREGSYTDGRKRLHTCYQVTMAGCERISCKLPLEDREQFLSQCGDLLHEAYVESKPEDTEKKKEAYTVAEAAKLAGVSQRWIQMQVAAGSIPARREKFQQVITNERIMIPVEGFNDFLTKRNREVGK